MDKDKNTQMIAKMSPHEYVQYTKFKQLYEDETIPVFKIASIFRVHPGTVTGWAKKWNIKLRSRGRKSKILDKFYKS